VPSKKVLPLGPDDYFPSQVVIGLLRTMTTCLLRTESELLSVHPSSQPSAVHGDVSKGSPQNHPGQDRRSVNRSKAAGMVAHGGGASTFGPVGRGHGHGKRGRGPGSGRVTRRGAG